MTNEPQYLLDANVFIGAEKNYYQFSFCPGFWEILDKASQKRLLGTLDRVKRELTSKSKEEDEADGRNPDPLKDWINQRTSEFFFSSETDQVVAAMRGISQWVNDHKRATPEAKSKFLGGADPWLVGYCVAHQLKLVTHEVSRPSSVASIKIPDVCQAFDVEYINTFQMLSRLNHILVARPRESDLLDRSF